MKLTRKYLATLGIEDEKAEQICEVHRETLNEIIEERDGYKEKAEKFDGVQKQLDDANKRVKELEDAAKDDTWKDKYDSLKKEYDGYKADVSAKELLERKKEKYREALKKAKLDDNGVEKTLTDNGIEKAIRYVDWNKVKLDEKGELTDSKEAVDWAMSEWSAYLAKTEVRGTNIPNPQGANGSGNNPDAGTSRPQSYAARRAAAYYKEHYGAKEE